MSKKHTKAGKESKIKAAELNMQRGLRLKAIREGKGLLQEDVATKAGIASKTLYRYESGEKPKLEVLQNIALALGVELKELL